MLAPAAAVGADSPKAAAIAEALNASEMLAGVGGTAKFEDDLLEIEYSVPESTFSDYEFPYEGSVIECVPGEITTYDEASLATSRALYAVKFVFAALKLNGYTQKQISAFFASENSEPTFDKNGFEIKPAGESAEYTSDDGFSTMTVTPMSIRVDVARANIEPADAQAKEPTATTVADVVDALNADETFAAVTDEEGKLYSENFASCDDETVTVDHTDYNYDYHYISFVIEDDVLVYEAEEATNYDEAESVSEHEMWALTILQLALEENGYTRDEIAEFFGSEDNLPDFERNGIEIRELGEDQTFEDETGVMTVSPMYIAVDLARANLDLAEENVADTISVTDTVTVTEKAPEPEQTPADKSPQTGDAAIAVAVMTAILATGIAITVKARRA